MPAIGVTANQAKAAAAAAAAPYAADDVRGAAKPAAAAAAARVATGASAANASYAERVGVALAADAYPPTAAHSSALHAALNGAPAGGAAALSEADARGLYTYRVPKHGADCSTSQELEKEPFDLRTVYGTEWQSFAPAGAAAGAGAGAAAAAGGAAPASASVQVAGGSTTLRLWRLQALVKAVAALTGSEWVGVYTRYELPAALGGGRALVKEAYVGEPSRALFPLTAEFAKTSNNSTVALTARAVTVQDVSAYAGPYYVCDGKVKSELCVPIVSPAGVVVGIIDAEAWRVNHFTPERVAIVTRACELLGACDNGRAL